MNLQGLDPVILLPAFAAGILVVATHVPLGQQVLNRGIIFIDLAVAQIAGLGVLFANTMNWHDHGLAVQMTAFGAALLGAIALYLCERRWPDVQEAVIGSSFVLAASAGILMLANNPHAGEHLKDLLVGQILWVDFRQLLPVAVLYGVILSLWFGLPKARQSLLFYILFALTITASVQLVGVYLVFASLIIPSLATRRLHRGALMAGYALGLSAYGIGLIVSAILDLPAGAVIVWTLAALAIFAAWAAQRRRVTQH
jgi:zinc/manganese transport system permease protein